MTNKIEKRHLKEQTKQFFLQRAFNVISPISGMVNTKLRTFISRVNSHQTTAEAELMLSQAQVKRDRKNAIRLETWQGLR